MRVVFSGQVPKEAAYAHAIEDAFELGAAAGRIAVSDGASESFDSGTWARILVASYVADSGVDPQWLRRAVSAYAERFDFGGLSWSQQSSFERGSFATLLGIEVAPGGDALEVLAVGDSVAALLSPEGQVTTFPYTVSAEFQGRPELFCTNDTHNAFLSDPMFFTRRSVTWYVNQSSDALILCMTDALAEWALKQAERGDAQWARLASIRTVEELEELVFDERTKRHMRVDDVTLVTLAL